MEFFKKKTQINFMSLRKCTAIISSLLFIASIASLCIYGLNWGLDFTGGSQLQISYTRPANLDTIRTQLNQVQLNKAVVQSYGTAKDVLISVPPDKTLSPQDLQQKVLHALPGATLEREEMVGPEVGSELANKGALAFIVALLGTMIYITMRFEWRFSVSAAVALIHD